MQTIRTALALLSFGLALACFPAKSPERTALDCRVDALRPAFDSVITAALTVREVTAHRLSLSDALAQAKVTAAEAKALRAAYEACDAATDAGVELVP